MYHYISHSFLSHLPAYIFQFKMADSNVNEGGRAGGALGALQEGGGLPFKRKAEQRSNFKSATDEQEVQSAPSLKASSNPPLPELQRQKRKMLVKPFVSLQSKNQYGFIEKEVRQHDNILLKQRNNLMSSQNMKLKTRITVLEKENERLQRAIDSQSSQVKPGTAYAARDKVRPADATLRAVIRGLRKEIEDLKKENVNIKSAVKFTSLKELETERDHLAEESIRLRMALEEQQAKRSSLKANYQGVSALQHRLHQLSQRNSILNREHAELMEKCKKLQQGAARANRAIENEKNLQKALNNARKAISEKQAEVDHLKGQLKTSSNIGTSASLPTKENKFEMRRPSIDRKNKIAVVPSRNEVAKSAQKGKETCPKCPKLEQEVKRLTEKCLQVEAELQRLGKGGPEIAREPIQKVSEEEVAQLRRFLTLRFKAHRLSYEQSEKYLVNCEGVLDEQQRKKEMTVRELMESLFVQPFCIVSNRYLQVLVVRLVYGEVGEVMLEEGKKISKGDLLRAYSGLLPQYQVMSQEKQEEMFIQVAELITTYYQQIMAALTAKRNGQGTIAQRFFLDFFREIELQQQYIDFIITQIILQSLDMQHLNFYAMFQIFYMPQMTAPNSKKKKFQVSNENVVHEEDEEYEESKSHLGSRNKTLEHKQGEEQYGWEQQGESKVKVKSVKEQGKEEGEEQYQQQYEQQKLQNEVPQPKAKSYVIDEEYD